jgi:hypothetical protein
MNIRNIEYSISCEAAFGGDPVFCTIFGVFFADRRIPARDIAGKQ